MENVLRIRVTVRKYLWKEFVYDVVYVTYATLMISNVLAKRYLKLTLRQLYGKFTSIPEFIVRSILYITLAAAGVAVMATMFAVPVILFLAAIGRIH